jgi:hypothetical protein
MGLDCHQIKKLPQQYRSFQYKLTYKVVQPYLRKLTELQLRNIDLRIK